MIDYFKHRNPEIKQYFKILSQEIPDWLEEYVLTTQMQRIDSISMSCGADYSKFFDVKYWFSNLDHSLGVALILWHFTNDKKQTLAGLFHDIATPVFKHCIDFLNGDSENQESTEERTMAILTKSPEILRLLDRDGIKISEIADYKVYPLADNNLPQLSADRFEYNFSSGLTFHRVWELNAIKEIFSNIIIVKNEYGIEEFAFKDIDICEKYIMTVSNLWPEWISDQDKTVMQFIADMCASLNYINKLSIEDLYSLSEKEVIDIIKTCGDKYIEQAWEKFSKCDKIYRSKMPVSDKYCINVKTKTRYVNPLVIYNGNVRRIYDVSPIARNCIDKFLDLTKDNYYTYFDFDFKPYKRVLNKE